MTALRLLRVSWLALAPALVFAACSGGDGAGASTSAGGSATTISASSTSSAAGGATAQSSSSGQGGELSDAGDAGDGWDGATFDCAVYGVPGYCKDTSTCAAMPEHTSTPGHCGGPANVECCTPFGTALCDPSVMPMPEPNLGNTTEAPGEGGCPAGMLRVTTFCIDRYEASLVRVADGAPWSPYYNPGMTPVRAISVANAVPQGYINGVQAGEACKNAGKRLCLDTEWLRACQGPNGYTYPYGDVKMLGVCNDHRDEHPAAEYFGTTANWIYSMIDNACINQLPETVDPTGARASCVTAEGAFDMMGNLHEWTADPAGTFRGGYYVDTVLNGPGCLYVTTAHDTSHWDYSTGFRCCAD